MWRINMFVCRMCHAYKTKRWEQNNMIYQGTKMINIIVMFEFSNTILARTSSVWHMQYNQIEKGPYCLMYHTHNFCKWPIVERRNNGNWWSFVNVCEGWWCSAITSNAMFIYCNCAIIYKRILLLLYMLPSFPIIPSICWICLPCTWWW